MNFRLAFASAYALVTALIVVPASADAVDDFYRGKQVRIVVGNAVGADYDLGGRLLARHMSPPYARRPYFHCPEYAGRSEHQRCQLHLQCSTEGRALVRVRFAESSKPSHHWPRALKADPRKFQWIGSSGTNTVVCYVRASSPVKSARDLFSRDLIVGGIGSGSSQSSIPTALNRLLGMRFKVVEGYKGNADALVALERAEIDGLCSGYSPLLTTHASLLDEGRVRLILHSRRSPIERASRCAFLLRFRQGRADEEDAELSVLQRRIRPTLFRCSRRRA